VELQASHSMWQLRCKCTSPGWSFRCRRHPCVCCCNAAHVRAAVRRPYRAWSPNQARPEGRASSIARSAPPPGSTCAPFASPAASRVPWYCRKSRAIRARSKQRRATTATPIRRCFARPTTWRWTRSRTTLRLWAWIFWLPKQAGHATRRSVVARRVERPGLARVRVQVFGADTGRDAHLNNALIAVSWR
jgi:hypothetical protein